MFGKEETIKKKQVVDVPDYRLAFSYVDKGVPLYSFSNYKPKKLTTRLQVINALSYGSTLYVGVKEEDYA